MLYSASLAENRDNTISRSPEADITVADPAVSRSPHAAIRLAGDGFVVEQLRLDREAVRVNGQGVSGPTKISDGDTIEIGPVSLVLHDLATGDHRSGYVVCTTCGHRNDLGRTECWFDGENLANAQSAVYDVSRVQCRVLASGQARDLREGDLLAVGTDGGINVNPDPQTQAATAAEIRAGDDGVSLKCSPGVTCLVNREPATEGQSLRTGDLVQTGSAALLTIVR
jgi:hypothetical protein